MATATNQPAAHKDIVVDSCVMRLYDAPADPRLKHLFTWLYQEGTLCISLPLVHEYNRHGNPLVASLLNYLGAQNRLSKIEKQAILTYVGDARYRYTCNKTDIHHARLTFLSRRKRLVSFDHALVKDVNRFRSVDGIRPRATGQPDAEFLG